MDIEYISVPLELKTLDSGEFEGYGSTFGNVDLGGDVVMKGAFQESLNRYKADGEWPQMFWMHRPDQIPGIWLDMSEDSKGLKVRGKILPTSIGNDVNILMKAKAVRAMSIGFSMDSADSYSFKDGVRYLKKINLWEVSPVSLPMNPKARINAVKARLHASGMSITEMKRNLEHWFREKGFSKSEAVTLASRAFAPDDEIRESNFGEIPKSNETDASKEEASRRDAGDSEVVDDAEVERHAEEAVNQIIAGMIRPI